MEGVEGYSIAGARFEPDTCFCDDFGNLGHCTCFLDHGDAFIIAQPDKAPLGMNDAF